MTSFDEVTVFLVETEKQELKGPKYLVFDLASGSYQVIITDANKMDFLMKRQLVCLMILKIDTIKEHTKTRKIKFVFTCIY